jgi:uncharacterized protein
MSFEWDPGKNARNVEKHGVSFATAALIFEGPVFSAEDTRINYGEVRWNSIGMVAGVALLAVTHTDRRGVTRIISARPASQSERKRYDDTLRERTRPQGAGHDSG